MSNTISELKSVLGAGARTNKFEVEFELAGLYSPDKLRDIGNLLAKESSFPGKSIPVSEAYFRGRKTLLQGMTDYGNTWTVTFYETEDHTVRTWFLLWMRLMDDDITDMHNYSYITTASVFQLDSNGKRGSFAIDGAYTLLNCWPQEVGEMSLDASEVNTIGTFTVTFAFDSTIPFGA